jgi:hypothetical protein
MRERSTVAERYISLSSSLFGYHRTHAFYDFYSILSDMEGWRYLAMVFPRFWYYCMDGRADARRASNNRSQTHTSYTPHRIAWNMQCSLHVNLNLVWSLHILVRLVFGSSSQSHRYSLARPMVAGLLSTAIRSSMRCAGVNHGNPRLESRCPAP